MGEGGRGRRGKSKGITTSRKDIVAVVGCSGIIIRGGGWERVGEGGGGRVKVTLCNTTS